MVPKGANNSIFKKIDLTIVVKKIIYGSLISRRLCGRVVGGGGIWNDHLTKYRHTAYK